MKKTLKISTVILIIIAISYLIYKKSPQEKPNINIQQPINNITKTKHLYCLNSLY